MRLRPLVLPLTLAGALACAHRADPRLVAQPIAGRRWVSTLDVDHPLVGKIWDQRAGRLVDEAALSAAAAEADFLLLGEVHDNVDHHLLQARLVRAVMSAGRRPALAFEMIGVDRQPALDAALARSPRDPDALARAVGWDESGWPEFALYRPIFQAGLDAGVPVLAASLPHETVRNVVKKGAEALDPPLRVRLAKDEPLAPALLESLRAEMRESHCGALPETMLDPLVLAQRAKDAEMSARMESAGERGAILVSGDGHARTDRGVPAYLRADAPGKKVLAVALLEVEEGKTDPASYTEHGEAGPLPYDVAIFTPREDRGDPCEGMRHHRARERNAAAGAGEKTEKKDGATGAPAAVPAPPAAPAPR
jgi:uncharacterized iron-regulated protein